MYKYSSPTYLSSASMIFMSRLCTVVNTLVAPCTTISLFSGIASGVHHATNT